MSVYSTPSSAARGPSRTFYSSNDNSSPYSSSDAAASAALLLPPPPPKLLQSHRSQPSPPLLYESSISTVATLVSTPRTQESSTTTGNSSLSQPSSPPMPQSSTSFHNTIGGRGRTPSAPFAVPGPQHNLTHSAPTISSSSSQPFGGFYPRSHPDRGTMSNTNNSNSINSNNNNSSSNTPPSIRNKSRLHAQRQQHSQQQQAHGHSKQQDQFLHHNDLRDRERADSWVSAPVIGIQPLNSLHDGGEDRIDSYRREQVNRRSRDSYDKEAGQLQEYDHQHSIHPQQQQQKRHRLASRNDPNIREAVHTSNDGGSTDKVHVHHLDSQNYITSAQYPIMASSRPHVQSEPGVGSSKDRDRFAMYLKRFAYMQQQQQQLDDLQDNDTEMKDAAWNDEKKEELLIGSFAERSMHHVDHPKRTRPMIMSPTFYPDPEPSMDEVESQTDRQDEPLPAFEQPSMNSGTKNVYGKFLYDHGGSQIRERSASPPSSRVAAIHLHRSTSEFMAAPVNSKEQSALALAERLPSYEEQCRSTSPPRLRTRDLVPSEAASRHANKNDNRTNDRHTDTNRSGATSDPQHPFDESRAVQHSEANDGKVLQRELGQHSDQFHESDRAIIETPSPARVRDLKEKLWDPEEHLKQKWWVNKLEVAEESATPVRRYSGGQVSDRVQRYWIQHNNATQPVEGEQSPRDTLDAIDDHVENDNMVGTSFGHNGTAKNLLGGPSTLHSPQRTSRSLSPKVYRAPYDTTKTVGSEQANGRVLFKSRYYEAAERGLYTSNTPSSEIRTNNLSVRQTSLIDSLGNQNVTANAEAANDALNTTQTTAVVSNSNNIALPSSTDAADKSRASLVAKLSAVSRDDPQAALAEIDAILRAESGRSLSAKSSLMTAQAVMSHDFKDNALPRQSSVRRPDEQELDDDDDDDSSSDETSVSSITNPTYQSSSIVKKDNRLSGGKPRLSALDSYKNTPYTKLQGVEESAATKEMIAKIRSKRSQSPPPTTIKVSPSREKKTGEMHSDREPPFDALKGNPLRSEGSGRLLPLGPSQTSVYNQPSSNQQSLSLPDPEIAPGIAPSSSSEDLAEKIRRWDEISHGDVAVQQAASLESKNSPDGMRTMDSSGNKSPAHHPLSAGSDAELDSLVTIPASSTSHLKSRLRRLHPWDESIPARLGKIDVRDTSMENADGVELEFSAKYQDRINAQSKVGGAIPTLLPPARNLRRDRLSRASQRTLEEKGTATLVPQPRERSDNNEASGSGDLGNSLRVTTPSEVAGVFSGDNFEVDPKLLSGNKSGWEVTPRVTPVQQENAKTMSDEFDSAWVSLPSAFFSASSNDAIRRNYPVLPNTKERSPPRANVIETTGSVNIEAEISPLRAEVMSDEAEMLLRLKKKRHESIQTFSPQMSERGAALSRYVGSTPSVPHQQSVHSPYDETPVGQEQGRRPRRSDGVEVALDEGEGQIALPRRSGGGLRGLLKRRPLAAGSPADSAIISAMDLQGTCGAGSSFPDIAVVGRRGRSRSPSRGRARSLEERRRSRSRSASVESEQRRIRNPTIAQKFSRLLRVYDDADRKGRF